ncbi:MAG: VCBS repeat-containing protein [Vicingaceae bacterium]
MKTHLYFFIFALLGLTSLHSCDSKKPKKIKKSSSQNVVTSKPSSTKPVFELLNSQKTGVDFENTLVETAEVNFFVYQYLYNGGGVGIGDINNDGLPDIYFTGTVANDKIYLNQGDLNFKDITSTSGIQQNNGLKTGVSMVDINADGLLDIYVCRSGWTENASERANLLYINQGNNTFKESAAAYGLAETGNSVQAGFFDYDKDGDLDCFIAGHPLFEVENEEADRLRENPIDQFSDQLYKNNGNNTFTKVTKEAGVFNYGHGLGLALSDFNKDGWPDIYVANDFQSHDYYYLNNGDGTFSENAKSLISHVSYFAMGSDAADINNDGEMDLFVVEMLAEDNKRQKTNMAAMNPGLFWDNVKRGLHYQYMRNTLQYNNGRGSFSEIGYLSGVSNTDWSWAPLFADFDHDGFKDLAITNGYLNDTQDKDLVKKADKMLGDKKLKDYTEIIDLMNSTPIQNYVFKNQGDLTFTDKSEDWGFDFSGYSNGMAYGDLDNDGDIDLVVNNFNDPASVYKNTTSDQNVGHYLKVDLNGQNKNPDGYGTKLTLKTNAGMQFQEFWVARGFQSSCDQKVHFGIASGDQIKELIIEWPDGRMQTLNNIAVNQEIEVNYSDANTQRTPETPPQPYFIPLQSNSGFLFTHKENDYNDYEKEILLPHKQSRNGPKISIGDVNGDQIDDFYISGAAGQAGRLIVQLGQMQFGSSSDEVFQADAASEDLGATFFDADSDGDLDLYVVSGGNSFEPNDPLLQDRLYINNGQGMFNKAQNALPKMLTSGGTVTASDYDNDGDNDLFVGGRIVPGKYPFSPRSYLLENVNGKFKDVTKAKAPGLMQPGLITSAIWTDFNQDGKDDLIAVGEWTGILLYENQNNKLVNVSEENDLDKETGWWNKIVAVDIDQDGDQDYVIGNLGLNYKYHASKEEPFEVYAHDFDENGSIDIVLGYYNDGTVFPVRGRQCSSEQMPMIAEKFETYESFGEANIQDVYGDKLKEALHLTARNFASSVLINEGKGKFRLKQLPTKAQFAPVNGIIAKDFDKNGTVDLLLAGNLFQAEVETGRADAGRGLLLLGDGNGGFKPVSLIESGFHAPMDVKDLALLGTGPTTPDMILVGNNDFGLQIFSENKARTVQ